MSPNDLYYKRWDTHFGKTNVITDAKSRDKKLTYCFSDTYIQGTSINGLSAFHALNEGTLPEGLSAIRKLQSASKVQGEGNVLVAVCEAGAVSMYIGEVELLDATGNPALVKSDKVVGQINPLKGAFGTHHPESVKQHDNLIFWWSQQKRAFVQYSENGLQNISDYKFAKASYQLSNRVKSIEEAGNIVMIKGGIDPVFKEYLAQMKTFVPEVIVGVPPPTNLQISYNENEVTVTWTMPDGYPDYVYQIFDTNGYQIASGFGSGTDIELLIDYLNPGVNYTIRVRTTGAGGAMSVPVEGVIYIEGESVEPTPSDDAIAPSLNSPEVLPNATVGSFYIQNVVFDGTAPMVVSDITKPDWMVLDEWIVNSRTVRLRGFPGVDDIDTAVLVKFTVTNAAGSYTFEKTLNVFLP